MTTHKVFLALWLWPLLAVSQNTSPPTQADIEAIERAHAEVEPIKKNFRAALGEALKTQGPKKALPMCKVQVPKGKEKGITVGRTSLRLRNPKNAPNTWVKPYLEKYHSAKSGEVPTRQVIRLDEKTLGYIEPIFVEPVCLNCHGSQISDDVRAELKKLYPQDQATGYQAGDLRGFLWLEMRQ